MTNVLPKISVLLPVYNAEKYVKSAVDSILNQSFEDFELLILNDGSTDTSLSILESFNDKRIRIITNPMNLGLIATLNNGLKESKGQYIARMDADDIAFSSRFEKQVRFLDDHPDYVVVGSNTHVFGEVEKDTDLWEEDEMIRVAIYFENPFAHPSTMFRNEIIQQHSIQYNPDHLHAEDWSFWYELLKHGKGKNLKESLLKYRLEGQNITVKNHSGLKERIEIVYRHLLKDLYPHLTEQHLSNHWLVAKSKYEWSSLEEMKSSLKEMSEMMEKAGLQFKAIQKYFASKSEELFYGISNVSPKDARVFAKEYNMLNFKKWLYTYKKTLRK